MAWHNLFVIASSMLRSLIGCDVNEEYLPQAPCAAAQTQGDESHMGRMRKP
jgi:hypothetical protein